MNNIPRKLREEMASDPYYGMCARQALFHDHVCGADPLTGKLIEWEHAIKYKGKQLQEKWAIVPLCYEAHRGNLLDKDKNRYIALSRASNKDLASYDRADFIQQKTYLEEKYGKEKRKN
jgi:hypothetical protein